MLDDEAAGSLKQQARLSCDALAWRIPARAIDPLMLNRLNDGVAGVEMRRLSRRSTC